MATKAEKLTRSFGEYLEAGKLHCTAENWPLARSALTNAFKVAYNDKESYAAHVLLFKVATKQKDNIAADQKNECSVKKKNENAATQRKLVQQCLYHAKCMIRFQPRNPQGYFYYGVTLERTENEHHIKKALTTYQTGLRLSNERIDAYKVSLLLSAVSLVLISSVSFSNTQKRDFCTRIDKEMAEILFKSYRSSSES
jgi:hypothetical protein